MVLTLILWLPSSKSIQKPTIKRIVNKFEKEEIAERKTGSFQSGAQAIHQKRPNSIYKTFGMQEVLTMKVVRVVTEDLKMEFY